jgi:ABC-type antimicrobial peptide transport system permease subunit
MAQLRAPPFSSLAVVSRSERERSLLEDPIPLGVIGALALGFVVAAAFAAVGFAASATAAARARTFEFAVLRSLGLGTRQLSGWISIENGLVVALSLLGGTALGLAVSWLVLPYVALGTSGEPPVPPVVVSVPWDLVLLLELALLSGLVLVAAFQVVRIRGIRPAPVLRGGEGVVAQ